MPILKLHTRKLHKNYYSSYVHCLCTQGEKGSHFIAISFSTRKILYFDSFGSQQTNSNIENYLKRYRKKIIFTSNQIQHLFSSHCRFFVFRLFCVWKT